MSNASAVLRSLVVYGVCLPLAIILGYLLADPLNLTSAGTVLIVLTVLAAPLLLRWHHAWLIAMWNCTAMLFFIPGKPQVWMGLAAISLTISILQFTLNRNMRFLSVPSVAWPVLFLAVVVLVTARINGGISLRLFGGDTIGGKNYVTVLVAIMGYFAIINRRIPPKRAGLYVVLYFLGAATFAIANLPGVINPSFNFLFWIFPVADLSAFTDQNSVVAPMGSLISRVMGLAPLGLAIYCVMLARYGIRGVLDATKPWRLGVFCLFSAIGLLGGFRSTFIVLVMTLALLFYLERLHQTRMLLPVVFGFLSVAGLVVLFAPRLPLPIQRSLAVVPYIELDPVVRLDAASSSGWRLQMWRDLLPEVPRYLLVGKGYGFSAAEQAALRDSIASSELVGNYHNGPLSVIIPFGLVGAIGFLWFLWAGVRVVYRNYLFGDPAYHYINTFLFGYLVVKVIFFFTVFGSFHSDMPMFLGLIGLSITLNGGEAKPVVVPQPAIVFNRFKLHPSVRRPAGA